MLEKITSLKNRELYDAIEKVIGSRPFFVSIPDENGMTICLGNLSDDELVSLARETFVMVMGGPKESEECPPINT